MLAPPFDVIDAERQAALHEASPYNVVRLELGQERAGDGPEENRYTRAAAALSEWRSSRALVQEDRPAFYVYVHEFEHEGRRHKRTALLGRVRLAPWEAGSVRPHEETMRGPKEDRLQLLRHLRTNVSPIFALYRDPNEQVERLLPSDDRPLLDTTTPPPAGRAGDGGRHTLFALTDATTNDDISTALRDVPLYVLDGHHRYETALAYRDERRAQGGDWRGDAPENFVLVAITSVDDPGLVLLPTHRLVRPPSLPPDVVQRLERFFHVEDTTPKSYDGTALLRLLARLKAGGSFGALGLEEGRLHLLTLREPALVRSLMPKRSHVWQALDVSTLEYAVLRETLGVTSDTPNTIAYTEDPEHALREVESGRWPLAFLLNPTRVDQIIAVADAGERMPAKSTYFYPKLATGLVLNPFD